MATNTVRLNEKWNSKHFNLLNPIILVSSSNQYQIPVGGGLNNSVLGNKPGSNIG